MSPEYPITIETLSDEPKTRPIELLVKQPGLEADRSGGTESETSYDFNAPTLACQRHRHDGRRQAFDLKLEMDLIGLAGKYIFTSATSRRSPARCRPTAPRCDHRRDRPRSGQRRQDELQGQHGRHWPEPRPACCSTPRRWPTWPRRWPGFSTDATMTYGADRFRLRLHRRGERRNRRQHRERLAAAASTSGSTPTGCSMAAGQGRDDQGVRIADPLPGTGDDLCRRRVQLPDAGQQVRRPTPFAMLTSIVDLTISDEIWGMFDPTAVLPRDPATVVIDTKGTANWLMDHLQRRGRRRWRPFPARLHSLDITELTLQLVGGRGDRQRRLHLRQHRHDHLRRHARPDRQDGPEDGRRQRAARQAGRDGHAARGSGDGRADDAGHVRPSGRGRGHADLDAGVQGQGLLRQRPAAAVRPRCDRHQGRPASAGALLPSPACAAPPVSDYLRCDPKESPMTRPLETLTAALLDAARRAGADAADALAVDGTVAVDRHPRRAAGTGGTVRRHRAWPARADRRAAGLRFGVRHLGRHDRRHGRTRRGHGARGAGRPLDRAGRPGPAGPRTGTLPRWNWWTTRPNPGRRRWRTTRAGPRPPRWPTRASPRSKPRPATACARCIWPPATAFPAAMPARRGRSRPWPSPEPAPGWSGTGRRKAASSRPTCPQPKRSAHSPPNAPCSGWARASRRPAPIRCCLTNGSPLR